MELKRYIDKNFLIVRFKLGLGEVKEIHTSEIVRNGKDQSVASSLRLGINGIPTEKIITPRAITVIVSGKIIHKRPGAIDQVYVTGDGAWDWAFEPESENEVRQFVGGEDNTEYHCIQPRDIHCKWKAKIHSLMTDQEIQIEETDKFKQAIYVCKGSIRINDTIELKTPGIIDVTPGKKIDVTALENSMIVELWIDGD